MKRKTDDCVRSSASLAVNGWRWIPVADFSESGPNDKHYVVMISPGGNSVVEFGDGVRGSHPKLGARVTASYRYGAGAEGNRRRRKKVLYVLQL